MKFRYEDREKRKFLTDLVKQGLESKMVKNKVLETLSRGEFSSEKFQMFSNQRYLATQHFTKLLEAGIQRAQEEGDSELAYILRLNLNDEKGLDEAGNLLPDGSHEEWRKNYYSAIGIDELSLGKDEPFPGTKSYDEALDGLMQNGNMLSIAGALLVLEGTIPAEFKKIKQGRDKTFKDTFVDLSNDTSDVLQKKRKARLYIDDHISHDASSHYPGLLQVLEKYGEDKNARNLINEGAMKIINAKSAFYNDLEEKLL